MPNVACANGGALVGMDGWLPTQAQDRDWGDLAVRPGCSHLVCNRCSQAVRSWPGWSLDRTATPQEAEALHASGDPSALAGAVQRGHVRLYACTCTVSQATTHRLAQGAWTDDMGGGLPWSCGGHPRPEPTATVHGIDLRWPAPRVVDEALAAPPLPGPHPRRWHTLVHVYGLISGAPVADAIAREVASRLGRVEDPVQVRCAWAFFFHHASAPGAEACGPAFLTHWNYLVATPDPVNQDGLLVAHATDTLTARLRFRDDRGRPIDRKAVEALGHALLLGQDPLLAYGLGEAEPEWLVSHATEFLLRWPDRLKLLLGSVRGRGGALSPRLKSWAGSDAARWAQIRQSKGQLSPEDVAALAGFL